GHRTRRRRPLPPGCPARLPRPPPGGGPGRPRDAQLGPELRDRPRQRGRDPHHRARAAGPPRGEHGPGPDDRQPHVGGPDARAGLRRRHPARPQPPARPPRHHRGHRHLRRRDPAPGGLRGPHRDGPDAQRRPGRHRRADPRGRPGHRHARPGPAAELDRRRGGEHPHGARRRHRAGPRARPPVVPRGAAGPGGPRRRHRGDPAHRALPGLHLRQERGQRRGARRRPRPLEHRERHEQGVVVPRRGPGARLDRARGDPRRGRGVAPGRPAAGRAGRDLRRAERGGRPDPGDDAQRHPPRRPGRQAVPHRHPVQGLLGRDGRRLPGLLPRHRDPADQRRDRHPARAGRRGGPEAAGLARRDPAPPALPGDPAVHGGVQRVAQPLARGDVLLRLRRLLRRGRLALRGGGRLPARGRGGAGRRGRPPALGQVLRRGPLRLARALPAVGGVRGGPRRPRPAAHLRQRVHRAAVRPGPGRAV
ncbi:MAG: Metal chaperone, involved in Zn homeostasis, partial [uncultured Quadrisphaera sp.]